MPDQAASRTATPNLEKLSALLEGARVGMLTSLNSEGQICSRPMTMQQLDSSGCLWFFVGLHAHLVDEIGRDARMNVSIVDGNKYISISGTGTVVADQAKAAELWNPLYKAWFPKGLEDPELRLVKVAIESAEYWDSPGGIMTTLVGFVKRVTTGAGPDTGEHGEITVGQGGNR